ncbi:VPS9 domain-containing protein [Entamoeba marina]
MDSIKFHSRLSYGVNEDLVKSIMHFIHDFPGNVKGKYLSQRKKKICGLPSIASLEHNDHTDSIILDSMYKANCTNHHYLLPKHFGIDGDPKIIEVTTKYIIEWLQRMDSVRSPFEKLMCLFCAYKIIEQDCYYFANKCYNVESFSSIMLYSLVQAELPQLSSTMVYLQELADSTDGLLFHYFELFSKSFKKVTVLSLHSLKINKEEYNSLVAKRMEELRWTPYLGLFPSCFTKRITQEQLSEYFGSFQTQREKIKQVIQLDVTQIKKEHYSDLIQFITYMKNELDNEKV